MIFGIRSAILSKNDLTVNPSIWNIFWTLRSKEMRHQIFITKKIPDPGSNCICWTLLLNDSVLKKDENYYP